MATTTEITIDGNDVSSINDFHSILKEKLNFPDYYGMNADALWDCLNDFLLSDNLIEVQWMNYKVSQRKFGNDAQILKQVFLDAHREFPNGMSVTIQD